MLAEGSWWVTSKSDPRWKASGRGHVGMLSQSGESRDAIEALKATYGEPPGDLEWGYMKD